MGCVDSWNSQNSAKHSNSDRALAFVFGIPPGGWLTAPRARPPVSYQQVARARGNGSRLALGALSSPCPAIVPGGTGAGAAVACVVLRRLPKTRDGPDARRESVHGVGAGRSTASRLKVEKNNTFTQISICFSRVQCARPDAEVVVQEIASRGARPADCAGARS